MGYVVATESFHVATKSGLQSIREGQTLSDKDPVVVANLSKFVPADKWLEGQSRVHSYVEAATAAPGELRQVKKPAKKATKKSPVVESVEEPTE